MLNFACAAKARKRTVTLTRPSRDEALQFAIAGGFERGFGIFISRVERGSKAEEIGLKRGDQVGMLLRIYSRVSNRPTKASALTNFGKKFKMQKHKRSIPK